MRASSLAAELVRAAAGGLSLFYCAVAATLASAQEFPPIKVDVQLVTLTATVEDSKGYAISGLKKEDFVVYEERVRQEIEVFQSERVPVSLGVVFDTSGSMVDKIEEVEDAVIHFIDTTNPEDEIFLVEFNFHASLVEDLTGDRQRLRRAVRRLNARGGTALYEAIVMGLQHLQRGRHKKKALLVITDGNDTSSEIGLGEAVGTTQQSEAIVYALGIGHGERGSYGHLPGMFRDTVDAVVLRNFTDATGGQTFILEGEHHKDGVDLIDQACQQVSAELRNQYTLGYYPKNKARDGSYRRIKVETRNPAYTVRTREGYYAPKAN